MIAALAARLDALERPRRSRAALVAVIAEAVESRAFTSAELFADAEVRSPALGAALGAARITTPKQLGRILRSIERCPVAGWTLERIGVERDGTIWRLDHDCRCPSMG